MLLKVPCKCLKLRWRKICQDLDANLFLFGPIVIPSSACHPCHLVCVAGRRFACAWVVFEAL
jgi:hypothetical protein